MYLCRVMEKLLTLESATLTWRNITIQNPEPVDVFRGVTVLTGPNGSGKSVLARIIDGGWNTGCNRLVSPQGKLKVNFLEKEGSAPLPKEIKEKRFQRIDILILESLYGIESDDVAFEYAQKLERARGFLRCIFYIWTGINVTGLANLSATVNNLIDHFSKESKIVKWVIKNSPKEYKFSNFTSNKGKNRLSELNDYDNERPTSFLECLVKHMCNSGTLLSEAIASVGKPHDDDDYYD